MVAIPVGPYPVSHPARSATSRVNTSPLSATKGLVLRASEQLPFFPQAFRQGGVQRSSLSERSEGGHSLVELAPAAT